MGAHDQWTLPPAAGVEEGVTFYDIGEGVRFFDVRGRWSDNFGDGSGEKIGYAVHHAGPPQALGDGTLAGDLAVMDAIHRFHTTPPPAGRGWSGIAYHRMIGAGRRVYLTGSSGSQRAHVSGLNHRWIGVCFLGDWSNGRPDDDRMATFRQVLQWETNQRQVSMLIAPHKRLEVAGTACPGSWASIDSWNGVVLQPQPVTPPVPAPVLTYEDGLRDGRLLGRAEVLDALHGWEM
jgi:hypothetical protein